MKPTSRSLIVYDLQIKTSKKSVLGLGSLHTSLCKIKNRL